MDTRAIGAILLKIAGLFLIAESVASLPAFFSPMSVGAHWTFTEAAATAAVTIGPTAVAGILFWFFPGAIVNKIVAPADLPETLGSRPIELVAVTLVGVSLISGSLVKLSRAIASWVVVQSQSPDHMFIWASLAANFVAIIVEAAIGVMLCIGARGVVDLIHRLRR
jgi:hypothetical protein